MTADSQRARYVENAMLVTIAQRTIRGLCVWITASWLARASGTFVRWGRHSTLYRWFTEKSEPNLVIVDLRETWIIGSFIALLDKLSPVFERTWHESYVRRLIEKLRTTLCREWVGRSRTIRLLRAALEPPNDET